MVRVVWTTAARQDIDRQLTWIARDDEATARKWGRKINASVRNLRRFPEIGSPVEDSRRTGLRELLVGPYRVIYRFDGTTCNIIAVLHAKQDIDRWLPPDDAP